MSDATATAATTTESAPRKRGSWLRRILITLLVIILLLVGAYVAIGAMADARLAARFDVAVQPITIPEGDAAAIERGQYLANAVWLCVECHGKNMAGMVVIDDSMLGRVTAPNLTAGKGSVTADFASEDWVRAIRFGVGHDKRPLVMMPSDDYWPWGDEDIASVVAWVKSLPAVDTDIPPIAIGPIAKLLLVQGQLPLSAERLTLLGERPAIAPKGPTAEYGKHLATVCSGCHRPDFSGGPIPGGDPAWPPARNITPHEGSGIGKWVQDDFVKAIRKGQRPNGTMLNDKAMPWPGFSNMTDDDLTALWLFLRSRTPVETTPTN
ncbi:MAG: c-type cytochrome [Planctomycetota bacterium]